MVDEVIPVRKDLVRENIDIILNRLFLPDRDRKIPYIENLSRVLNDQHLYGEVVPEEVKKFILKGIKDFMENKDERLKLVSYKDLKEDEGWLSSLLDITDRLQGYVTDNREMYIVWDTPTKRNRAVGNLVAHEATHIWQSDNILLMSFNLYESITEYLGWIGLNGKVPEDRELFKDKVVDSNGYNKYLAHILFSHSPDSARAVMEALAGDLFALEKVGKYLERIGEKDEAENIYANMVTHIDERLVKLGPGEEVERLSKLRERLTGEKTEMKPNKLAIR